MERNKLYYVAPNKCIGCNAEQSWFSKNYKFCSSACSTTFHNASRAPTSDATKLKISKSLSVTHTKRRSLLPQINQPPTIKLKRVKLVVESKLKRKKKPTVEILGEYSKLYKCKCKHCSLSFLDKRPVQFCQIHKLESTNARMRYAFRFNVYDYPDLFDLDQLTRVGFYAPGGKLGKFNPNGLSRDHRVSVLEAIKNDYDAYYVSHQLNCELMPHHQNNTKKGKSSIAYTDLVNLVNAFDLKRNVDRPGVEPGQTY